MKITTIAWASSITLVVAIIIASMLIYELNARVQSLQSTVASTNAELITRRNAEGKLLSEKLTAEIRVKELEQSMPDMARQIQKDFDIRLRNLRGYISAEFEARGEGNATVSRIPFSYDSTLSLDAESSLTIDYGTQHFSLSYLTRPNGSMYYLSGSDTVEVTIEGANQFPFAIIIDDGYLALQADVYSAYDAPYTYTYSDTAKMAFIKRGKWWQRKKLYGSVMFSNPQATVKNTTSILISDYGKKRFGIGPSVSYGWGSDGAQVVVGFSIHYSLIRL